MAEVADLPLETWRNGSGPLAGLNASQDLCQWHEGMPWLGGASL